MARLNGRRILIAEDEGLIALQLEDILHELQCCVIGPVSRVGEVRERIEAETCDGALLDVNLRGEQIFDVLPLFEERGIPYIVTSGYDALSMFPPRYAQVRRVVKPFDEHMLRRLCLETFGVG